jgi:hypothetical protein
MADSSTPISSRNGPPGRVAIAFVAVLGCGRIGYEETSVIPGAAGTGDATVAMPDGNDDASDASAVTDREQGSADVAVDTTAPDASGRDAGDARTTDASDAGCLLDNCTLCLPSVACTCESFGGHAYRFCSLGQNWNAAESECNAAGMQLVRVDDGVENSWIRATADRRAMTYLWLGATAPAGDAHWQWSDGTEFYNGGPVGGLFDNWAPGKPTGTSIRACGGMIPDAVGGQWDDRSCTAVYPYVCERY